MGSIRRLIEFRASSEKADSKFASLAAYFAALAVLVIGFSGIGTLTATRAELFIATLGVDILGLLLGMFGLVIEIDQRLRELNANRPETGTEP